MSDPPGKRAKTGDAAGASSLLPLSGPVDNGAQGKDGAETQEPILSLDMVPAQKLARLANEPTDQEGIGRGANLITVDGKSCTHEVAWPPGVSGSPSPPPLPPQPPAKSYPFPLDPFQKTAIAALEAGQSVLVAAHTSAGKTVVAQYCFAMALRDGCRVIYTSPLKALSNQKYREFAEEFKDVGLMTGDVTINPNASCLVMTTEILRSMLYNGSEIVRSAKLLVYDEIHYLRDKERGVVWEESIILAPKNCRFAFLSATIPNAREFAEWVAKVHASPCHVVYTDYRPTPLQHYMFPAGGAGLYLVVDEKGVFREDNFGKCVQELQGEVVGGGAGGKKKKEGKDTGTGEKSDIYKVIKLIMERNYDPVIVFSFSKRECESLALNMAQLDLCSEEEKKMTEHIYWNALDVLDEDDRKLPQVVNLLPMLKRGIGVHHSGLLPILKEVVEILFQEGLLKALFATETFSTGLNMPAKTVVFTGARKWDGGRFRLISPGEYIQMSGRAGRRGLDDRGVVILMMDARMDPPAAKEMVRGAPDVMYSEFHLGYSMILNLMRLEGREPSDLVRESYRQFQAERALPQLERRIALLSSSASSVSVPDLEGVASLKDALHQALLARMEARGAAMMTPAGDSGASEAPGGSSEGGAKGKGPAAPSPPPLVPFLQPGRLVRVVGEGAAAAAQGGRILELLGGAKEAASSSPQDPASSPPPLDWRSVLEAAEGHWGAIISFEKRYLLDVLIMCDADSVAAGAGGPKAAARPLFLPAGDDARGVPCIVTVSLAQVTAISSVRIYLPKDLRTLDQRTVAIRAVQEVQRRLAARGPGPGGAAPTAPSSSCVPELDPLKDLRCDARRYSRSARRCESILQSLASHPLLAAEAAAAAAARAAPTPSSSKPSKGKGPRAAQQDGPSPPFMPLVTRLALLEKRRAMEEEAEVARREARAARSLILKEELGARQRVLQRLGYLDPSLVVTLKGQVACQLATGDELVLAEMLFSGAFNDLSGEQLTAVLSCFVWSEKGAGSDRPGGPRVSPPLESPLSSLREAARRVARVMEECRLGVDVEEYVEGFRPEIMEAVAAWYMGMKFSEVLKLSSAFEGSFVRALRRLEEVMRQLAAACGALGEAGLGGRIEEAREKIRRGVVFSASLYL